MTIANASETQISHVTESTLGTTPTSPSFQKARVTGESLRFDTNTGISNELRADRNVPDLVRLGQSASGGLNFELSYGTFDDFLESALFGTWTSDELKNALTRKSFTFEKLFEQGGTDAYIRTKGMVVNELTLTCEAQAIITGSMSFMGTGGATATAGLAGATYAEPNTNEVLSASDDFASLAFAGISPSPTLSRVELRISNNLRAQPAVGQIDLAGIGTGRFMARGSVSAYFESIELYDKYLDGDEGSLQFTLGQVAGEKYTFDIPRLKFENGDVNASGNDQDVMAEMEFIALYDGGDSPAHEATINITRGVS